MSPFSKGWLLSRVMAMFLFTTSKSTFAQTNMSLLGCYSDIFEESFLAGTFADPKPECCIDLCKSKEMTSLVALNGSDCWCSVAGELPPKEEKVGLEYCGLKGVVKVYGEEGFKELSYIGCFEEALGNSILAGSFADVESQCCYDLCQSFNLNSTIIAVDDEGCWCSLTQDLPNDAKKIQEESCNSDQRVFTYSNGTGDGLSYVGCHTDVVGYSVLAGSFEDAEPQCCHDLCNSLQPTSYVSIQNGDCWCLESHPNFDIKDHILAECDRDTPANVKVYANIEVPSITFVGCYDVNFPEPFLAGSFEDVAVECCLDLCTSYNFTSLGGVMGTDCWCSMDGQKPDANAKVADNECSPVANLERLSVYRINEGCPVPATYDAPMEMVSNRLDTFPLGGHIK